jgi:hypothetical protein
MTDTFYQRANAIASVGHPLIPNVSVTKFDDGLEISVLDNHDYTVEIFMRKTMGEKSHIHLIHYNDHGDGQRLIRGGLYENDNPKTRDPIADFITFQAYAQPIHKTIHAFEEMKADITNPISHFGAGVSNDNRSAYLIYGPDHKSPVIHFRENEITVHLAGQTEQDTPALLRFNLDDFHDDPTAEEFAKIIDDRIKENEPNIDQDSRAPSHRFQSAPYQVYRLP